MRRWTAGALLAGALIIPAVVAGCGVPTDSSARPVPAVPYDLLSPSSSEPSASASVPALGPRVWLVRDDELVGGAAATPRSDVRTTASAMLQRLAEGPTERQRADGLSTALGPDVRLALTDVSEGRVVVDIEAGDQVPSPGRLPLAVGQLVLTLTSIDGVDEVVLMAGGALIEAPLPGGALTASPLRADDYTALRSSLSRRSAPTSPSSTATGPASPTP